MIKPVLQNISIILGDPDMKDYNRLSRTLSLLFSHVNLTSNLYLVAKNLPESMSQIERIHQDINAFLSESLFARLHVHYVHNVSEANLDDTRHCYQYIKQATWKFDREGYAHQEMPRLMLLPVIVPDDLIEAVSLLSFLDALKSSFLLTSLYLNKTTFAMAQNDEILARIEKVYYGPGNSGELPDVICNMFYQNILDDSFDRLASDASYMSVRCPASLIISAQDGKIYGCIDACRKNEEFADIYGKFNTDALIEQNNITDNSKRDCLVCRERATELFADLPMPQDKREQIGALLCHFGTLYQAKEEYLQAAKKYEKSLMLSPIDEASHIYFRLGLSYTMIGHYNQALKVLNSAELTYANQHYFHFYKGLCYFEMGNYRMAVEEFSEALNLQPEQEDRIRILIYKGTCYNNLGEYERAAIELERAGESAGRVKEIFNALGFSYFQLKNYDRSIENLNKVVEIDPYSAIDYASLGSNYREKGDIKTAIDMFEKALTLDPNMTSARENLERLKKR